MIWLVANWKLILGIVAGFVLAWGIQALIIKDIQTKEKATLAAQVQFDIQQCNENKQITTKSEQSYEDQIANLNADLQRLRNQPAKLVYVTKPADQRNAANISNQSCAADAIDSGRFYDFSGECEQDRIKVMVLQQFIKDTWKTNGHP